MTTPFKRIRYLPPGAVTEMKTNSFLAGFCTAAACGLFAGAAVVAATPAELYRPAPATTHPVPSAVTALPAPLILTPCVGEGKDCTEPDPEPAAPTILAAPGRSPALRTLPVPQVGADSAATAVPAPGTLALIVAGAAAICFFRRKK